MLRSTHHAISTLAEFEGCGVAIILGVPTLHLRAVLALGRVWMGRTSTAASHTGSHQCQEPFHGVRVLDLVDRHSVAFSWPLNTPSPIQSPTTHASNPRNSGA